MVLTRSKVRPAVSSGTIVFAKVGAAGSFAILSMSARFSAIATSSAGLNDATWTLSKGGTPPYGPAHSASSGLGSAGELLALVMRLSELSAAINAVRAATNSNTKLRVINFDITNHSFEERSASDDAETGFSAVSIFTDFSDVQQVLGTHASTVLSALTCCDPINMKQHA